MHDKMIDSARRSLEAVLELQRGERFLAITDEAKGPIGQAFRDAAVEIGCESTLHMLDPAARPLAQIPRELMAAIGPTDVVVNCFAALAEETPFRIALIHTLTERPRRVGHAPGITEDMMLNGPMNVDFAALRQVAGQLIAALRNASYARITAPGGTDLTLYIEHRPFDTDVKIEPGHFGNLPCGEIWCAPVEQLGEGTLVCDGSIGDLGPVPAPVVITMESGRVKELQCADESFRQRVELLLAIDEDARVVGEFGIGINQGARITGNLLEDEKAFKTAHVAFGNNEDMPGGRNRSKTHRDFLFREPDITVHYVDGRAVRIIEGGLVAV
jgi:aminopeptidase